MKSTQRHIIYTSLLAFASVFLTTVPVHAQTVDPQLEKILADWQKRREWVKTIRYRVSGNATTPKGAFNSMRKMALGLPEDKDCPPRDVATTAKYTLLFDFDKGRHRFERDEQQYDARSDRVYSWKKVDAFNGSVLKMLMPKDPSLPTELAPPPTSPDVPNAAIVSGNMKYGAFDSRYCPLFYGHGRIYTAMDPVIPGKLLTKPDSEYLYVHGKGVHDGHTCVIVRTQTLKLMTTSFTEYWVDTARTSAILRVITFSGDKPFDSTNIKYRKTSIGWLPDSWTYTGSFVGQTARVERMRVDELTINPGVADSDFDIQFEPGTVVEERKDQETPNPLVNPGSTGHVYRIEKSNHKVEIADVYGREGFKPQPSAMSHLLSHWYWLLPIMLCVAICLYWGRKRFLFEKNTPL